MKSEKVRIKAPETWVKACDREFLAELRSMAEQICETPDLKLIGLVGPSCAGKTTVARMLSRCFEERGKRLHIVSIDDFFYDIEELLKLTEGSDEIDYDSPDTIDTDELRRFVREIFDGDKSRCPIFSFTSGKREGFREYLCQDEDIFLFEGIQVLYPEVVKIFDETGHKTERIYIAPESTVKMGGESFSPNDIRLMRRIVRDRNFRNTDAQFTLDLWGGVRRNEEQNIFPYKHLCTYNIDSTMPYELGMLKPYLLSALAELAPDSKHREYAKKTKERLARVLPLSEKMLAEDSLYREFV